MLKDMDMYNQIAYIAVLVGGILWGIAGLINLHLTDILGGFIGRILYIGIGVAAGWLSYQLYLEKMKKPV